MAMQICLSAAAMLATLRPIIYRTASRVASRQIASGLALWLPYLAVVLFALLSLSRGVSLVVNYSAPMHIYRALPQVPSLFLHFMPERNLKSPLAVMALKTIRWVH